MTTPNELTELLDSVETARQTHHPDLDGSLLREVVKIEIEYEDDEAEAMKVIGRLFDKAVSVVAEGKD